MAATVHDVAAYILREHGAMSAMKLQKLVYYSQAWHATWDGEALFDDEIQAWANGPVAPALFNEHRGMFKVGEGDISGDPDELSPSQKESVDVVLQNYGNKSPQWLSDLTHAERPWQKAREGLGPTDRGSAPVSLGSMVEYYSTLL